MSFTILVFKTILVMTILFGLICYCTWVERKGSALLQNRIGANRAGRFATTNVFILKPFYWIWRVLGQLGVINTLLCDSTKALLKEDFVPSGVSVFMHAIGPFIMLVSVFTAFAVFPWAPEFSIDGQIFRLQIAEGFDGGLLLFLAMASLAMYGMILGGFTSNNKFSVLGSLRALSQVISYELAMGTSLVTAFIFYESFDLYQIALKQNALWGIISNPMMFVSGVVFFVAALAETKRLPFDLPESESELVAGYFTEYSGMKFLLFWMAEFVEISLVSLILALVYFGAWHPFPFLTISDNSIYSAVLGHFILIAKVLFFNTLQIVIRWTLPRFRYDQLMNLGWKALLEIGFVNILAAAAFKLWQGN